VTTKRLVLGGSALGVVSAVAWFDLSAGQATLVASAVAIAVSPWLAAPLRRGGGWLRRAPERRRSLEGLERRLVRGVVTTSALMAVSVLGPWVVGGRGAGGGLDLPHPVAQSGVLVLLAALGGCTVVLLTAPSVAAPVGALLAGAVGTAATLDVREYFGEACPSFGPAGVLGLFCAEPTAGWGLRLATIASVALLSIGLVWLCVAALKLVHARRPATPGL